MSVGKRVCRGRDGQERDIYNIDRHANLECIGTYPSVSLYIIYIDIYIIDTYISIYIGKSRHNDQGRERPVRGFKG